MRILSACLSQLVVTVVQVVAATLSRTDSTHTRGSNTTSSASFCLAQKLFSSPLTMSYIAPLGVLSFLVFDTIFFTFPTYTFSKLQPCADLRRPLSGALAEPPSFTGYELKQFAENQDHRHFTEDKQFAEHQDLRVKPLFFHQPSTASTYDSAESIATPFPDSDLDDEQFRARSKCRTIANLSLWTRKLDVQFISRSDKYRETCRFFFKQK